VLTKKDRLAGHLLVETFDPGDFHVGEDAAHFARAELSYSF